MKTIVVIDDEMDISEAVRTILEGEGYQVVTFTNGMEAISYLEKNPPALVLLDIMMPLMSGFEVLKSIRSTPGGADLPVLLMSAVTPSHRPSTVHWQGFLRKPFTLDTLVDTVRKLTKEGVVH